MPRKKGAPKTLRITENSNRWLEERHAAFKRGEVLPLVYEGRLRYKWRTQTSLDQRREGLADELAFGTFKDARKWKMRLSGHISDWCHSHGVTRADLGIINEEQGHISNGKGELVPYTRGEKEVGAIVLLVEKLHIAAPLARVLDPLGITVVDTKGESKHLHRGDVVRWLGEGKKVLCLTDEDLAGSEIASVVEKMGAERLRLADIEEVAGEKVAEEAVEPDLSYTKQGNAHNRISKSDHARLMDLGQRVGLKGPGRVELDAQIESWGDERYGDLVAKAILKKTRLRGPADTTQEPTIVPMGLKPWWE